MKFIMFALLTCVTTLGQTSVELRQKYGASVSETFRVRPEIIVTVSYDHTGKVSEMLIKPQPDDDPIKSSNKRIKSQMLREIIDELAPPKVRGKFVIATFMNIACLQGDDCGGVVDEYENVIVYRNGNTDEHRYATIRWKRAIQK